MSIKYHMLHYNINLKADTIKRFGFLPYKEIKEILKRFKTL